MRCPNTLRPCTCDKDTCTLCKLYHTSETHRRNWDRPRPAPPTPAGTWVDHYASLGTIDPPTFPPLKLSPTSKFAVVTLANGEHGRAMAELSVPIFEQYAQKIGADFHVIQLDDLKYPLSAKFRIADYLDYYDRLIFLDIDIILAPDCPDLFQIVPAGSVGMHDDGPFVVGNGEWIQTEWDELCDSQGIPRISASVCYNTGVVVCDRSHKGMWQPPAKPYRVTHCSEQHWVNLNCIRAGLNVRQLPRVHNWQWWIDREYKNTTDVKVWHFAGASQMLSHAQRVGLMRAKVQELYPGTVTINGQDVPVDVQIENKNPRPALRPTGERKKDCGCGKKLPDGFVLHNQDGLGQGRRIVR